MEIDAATWSNQVWEKKKGFEEYSLQMPPCFYRSAHKQMQKPTLRQLFGNPDAPSSATAMFWGIEFV